ncbi:MAG: hypothetical protein Q9191_001954 [Dirinaria sp. TL-2023a]
MSKAPQPASGSRAEKTMSSRLLTMKFMQRAAASSPAQPTTPASQTSQIPSQPPSKRQKVSPFPSTPATPLSDQQAIQAALNAEEAKHSEALERIAAERGETKWILSCVDEGKGDRRPGFRVTKAGYGDIDADENAGPERRGKWGVNGRRSFGKFNKELERQQNNATSDTSSSSSDEVSEVEAAEEEDGQGSNDASGTGRLIRQFKEKAVSNAKAEYKASKRAAKAQIVQLAARPLNTEINLNKLSSISGAGGLGGNCLADKDRGGKANFQCYNCGEKGHVRSNCPRLGRKRELEYDGASAKKRSKKVETLNR